MDEIIKILMGRDGYTKEEALGLLREVRDDMESCNYEPDECEDIFTSMLRLEPDYMVDFLYWCV